MKFSTLILAMLLPLAALAGGINTYPVQGSPGANDFALGCRTNSDGSFTTELLPATALGGGASSAVSFRGNTLATLLSSPNSQSFSTASAGTGNNRQGGTNDTQSFFCFWYKSPTNGLTDIKIVLGNWLTGAASSPNVLYVQNAVLDYPSNTLTKFTFNGNSTATIAPNGYVVSDSLPMTIPPNIFYNLRGFVTVPTNAVPCQFPVTVSTYQNLDGSPSGGKNFSGTNIVDYSMTNFSVIAGLGTYFGYGYAPVSVLGKPIGGKQMVNVGVDGDSIASGIISSGAYPGLNQPQSYLTKALNANGYSVFSLAFPGKTLAQTFSDTTSIKFICDVCSSFVNTLGVNDLYNGASFATLTNQYVTLWSYYLNHGIAVWQATITPRNSSADNYTSTNQTSQLPGGDSTRKQLNSWIRTNGIVPCLDIAAQAETFTNSGIWIYTATSNTYTSDGLHPTTLETTNLNNYVYSNCPAFK